MKNIELNNIELAPLADFETETSSYYEHYLNRAKDAAKAENITVARVAAPEHDTFFQRLMSSFTGLLQPKPDSLASCDVVPNFDSPIDVPAIPSGGDECIVIKSKQQLRTLYHLLHADEPDGIPILELQALVGSGNQWDVAHELRNKLGDDFIQRTDFLIMNKTGKTSSRGNYWMTSESKRIAAGILARSGYVHNAAADHRHVGRPGQVLAEFMAVFPGNDDDLLFVRDGTKAQWLRLLYRMRVMNGEWVSRYVADELLDSRNVRQVVRIANAKVGGVAIESKTRTMPNRDDGICEYGVYRLADDWVDKADKVIKDKLASAGKVAN